MSQPGFVVSAINIELHVYTTYSTVLLIFYFNNS